MCNSVPWDEADARVRSYPLLCLGMEGQRQVQQKRPGLNLQTTTSQLIQILEEIFITHKIIAFERYNFICRKQRKNWNNFTQIWYNKLLVRVAETRKTNGYVIYLPLAWTMKKSLRNYSQRHEHHKKHLNMRLEEKRVLNIAKIWN